MEKQTFTPTAADWARYGARPMTLAEIKAEKALIEKLRKQSS